MSEIAATHLAQPAIEAAGKVAGEAAGTVNWTLVAITGMLAVVLPFVARFLWRRRPRRAALRATN